MTGPVKYITANYTLHYIVRQKWAISKKPIIDSRNHKCIQGVGGGGHLMDSRKKLCHKNAIKKTTKILGDPLNFLTTPSNPLKTIWKRLCIYVLADLSYLVEVQASFEAELWLCRRGDPTRRPLPRRRLRPRSFSSSRETSLRFHGIKSQSVDLISRFGLNSKGSFLSFCFTLKLISFPNFFPYVFELQFFGFSNFSVWKQKKKSFNCLREPVCATVICRLKLVFKGLQLIIISLTSSVFSSPKHLHKSHKYFFFFVLFDKR